MAAKVTSYNASVVRDWMPTDESTETLSRVRYVSGVESHLRRLLKFGWLEIVPRTTDRLRYTEQGKQGLAAMGFFSGAPYVRKMKQAQIKEEIYGDDPARSAEAMLAKPKSPTKITIRYGRVCKA